MSFFQFFGQLERWLQYLQYLRNIPKKLGGAFNSFYVHPENWGRVPPILTIACFWKGLVQPPTRLSCFRRFLKIADGSKCWRSCRAKQLRKTPEKSLRHPVDGSEIRRSPVEVGSWNPIIYKVLAPSKRWLFGISEPTTGCLNLKLGGNNFHFFKPNREVDSWILMPSTDYKSTSNFFLGSLFYSKACQKTAQRWVCCCPTRLKMVLKSCTVIS